MNYRPIFPLLLAGVITLTGCSSLLERDYTTVNVHSAVPVVESDQLTIRAESYQDLVNALLYFITQGQEEGTIRLYNYPYDVERDMAAACREVTQVDPLGAYAVDSIQYDLSPIVSCYEAQVNLTYRRTHQQVEKVVPLTGSSAIRDHLKGILAQFQTETAMRVSYFTEDEDYIRHLIRQAYWGVPGSALGFPSVEVHFYPDSGRQRVVELRLTYPLSDDDLKARQHKLDHQAGQLVSQLKPGLGDKGLLAIRKTIQNIVRYAPDKGGSTPYHALVTGSANSEGLALSMALLCQRLNYSCQIVEGTLDGVPHFWTIVSTQDGSRHLDLSHPDLMENGSPFLSDQALAAAGYHWNRELYPVCGAQTGDSLPQQR